MGGDHNLDALSYMGMKIQSSPHIPDGKALIVDDKLIASLKSIQALTYNTASAAQDTSSAIKGLGKSIAGLSADFVVYDEWADIQADHLAAVANGNKGILKRAAEKEIDRREREQAELEQLPGYGSF